MTTVTEENKNNEELDENIDIETSEVVEETVDNIEETDETVEVEVEPTEVEKLEQEKAELFDKYQRQVAEFDNFRKRTIKEKATMYGDGITDTVEKLLPVIDNFERAMATETNKDDTFYKGVEMIYKQFNEFLTGLGVEAIQTVGETFDANLHFAVQHEENEEFGENTVSLELQKGYKYKDKVVRPAMVKVAN